MNILLHIVAGFIAIVFSCRYLPDYELGYKETIRFIKKSFNLAICYVGFSKKRTFLEAYKAGYASYICSAYDVITDWKNFESQYYDKYISRLEKRLSFESLKIVEDLYHSEITGKIKEDGLERGYAAFKFIIQLMEIEKEYQPESQVYEIGKLCQIVDDILDYESDVRLNETNCLITENKEEHLRFFFKKMKEWDLNKLFPYGYVLLAVINKAAKKAQLFESFSNEYESERTHHKK